MHSSKGTLGDTTTPAMQLSSNLQLSERAMYHDHAHSAYRFLHFDYSGWLKFFPFSLHGCVIGDITGSAF